MKKLVFGIALMAVLAFSAYAQQHCPESHFRVEPIDGGVSVRILEYLGDNWTVRIPAQIRGLPVTHIGQGAFRNRNLISVTLPATITHIEANAFRQNQLTSIDFPANVTSIGQEAFRQNLLTSVSIPSTLTNIGTYTFANNRLTSVTIPNFRNIGQGTFANNHLTSVTIPSSFTSIGNNTFANNRLSSVTIPDGVTSIGNGAFRNNQLTNVTIPNNVLVIGIDAFAGNLLASTPLTAFERANPQYDVANSFNFSVSGGFVTITGIRGNSVVVRIPSQIHGMPVIAIGADAFNSMWPPNNWHRINSVVIPNSVISIGHDAFANNNLTSVIIPKSVTSIGDNAFGNNRLTSVTIPDRVFSIGNYAFFGNPLTSVTIPYSVNQIGHRAFFHNRMTSVSVPQHTRLGPHNDPRAVFGNFTTVTRRQFPAFVGVWVSSIGDMQVSMRLFFNEWVFEIHEVGYDDYDNAYSFGTFITSATADGFTGRLYQNNVHLGTAFFNATADTVTVNLNAYAILPNQTFVAVRH